MRKSKRQYVHSHRLTTRTHQLNLFMNAWSINDRMSTSLENSTFNTANLKPPGSILSGRGLKAEATTAGQAILLPLGVFYRNLAEI